MKKQNENAEISKAEEAEKATRKPSYSFLIRAFGNNVKKLIELGLVNEEEAKQLKELKRKIVAKFVEDIM